MKKYLVLVALVLAVFSSLTSALAQGPGEEVGSSVDEGSATQATDTPADNQAAPDEQSNGTVDEGSQNVDTTVAPVAAPDEQIGGTVDELLDDVGSLGGLEEADAIQAAELTGTSAAEGPWSSTIYVSNPNNAAATADIVFYDGAGTQAGTSNKTLNAFGSAVIDVASVGNNFKGSAIVSSDQTLAVQVGLSVSSSVDRMLYTGFSQGNNKVSSPALLCNIFGQNSDLVVMNVGSASANVTVSYAATYKDANDTSKGTYTPATKQTTHTIPANSSKYLSACTELGITKDWSGSVTVTGGASDKLVGVIFQPFTDGPKAVSYETVVGEGSSTVYFPQAMNRSFPTEQTTYYAIQNVGSTETTVNLEIFKSDGTSFAKKDYVLAPGGKVSTGPEALDVPLRANFSGSAVAKASSGGKIAAVTQLKAFKAGTSCPTNGGLANQYLNAGDGATDSSYKLAVPWIEYKTGSTDWEAFIAVQNIGSAVSGKITVSYYAPDGTKAGSASVDSLVSGGKKSFNSKDDKITGGESFLGSMVIESENTTDKLVATSSNKQANECNGSGAPAIVIK